jgi:hypothetical protein
VKKKDVNEPIDKSTSFVEPQIPIYSKTWSTFSCVLGAIFAIVVGVFVMSDLPILGIFMFIDAGLFICLIFYYKSLRKKNNIKYVTYQDDLENYNNNINKAKEEYTQAVEKYNQDKLLAEEQYQREYNIAKAKTDEAKQAANQFDNTIKEIEETLKRLYDVNLIFPKYRNMVAMCTIYEYFASGRVTTLEGPDGAYNLYESELRQNLIINKLDTIVSQLEQIKENQYTLYIELKKTNDVLKNISNDVRNIYKNTEDIAQTSHAIALSSTISACCLKAIEKNTEAIKYLSYING